MTSDLCNLPERLNQERKISGRNFLENLELLYMRPGTKFFIHSRDIGALES